MENLIKEAIDYISNNNTLVEEKEFSKWEREGIVKSLNKIDNSLFPRTSVIGSVNGKRMLVII